MRFILYWVKLSLTLAPVTAKQHLPKAPPDTVLVGAKVPAETARRIRLAVAAMDTDISKFLRAAIREKLGRLATRD